MRALRARLGMRKHSRSRRQARRRHMRRAYAVRRGIKARMRRASVAENEGFLERVILL